MGTPQSQFLPESLRPCSSMFVPAQFASPVPIHWASRATFKAATFFLSPARRKDTKDSSPASEAWGWQTEQEMVWKWCFNQEYTMFLPAITGNVLRKQHEMFAYTSNHCHWYNVGKTIINQPWLGMVWIPAIYIYLWWWLGDGSLLVYPHH